MNTVELIARIQFYSDRTKSPRFNDTDHYLPALNVAQNTILNDRYYNIKKKTGYSFETVQRLRDELRSLVRYNIPILVVSNAISLPNDYMFELMMNITIDGTSRASKSVSYNEINSLSKNSFQEPSIEYPVHFESDGGINFLFGDTGTPSTANLTYLRKPATIFKDSSVIVAGVGVLTIGNTYYVNVGPVTSDSITYATGDTFVATSADMTGGGDVTYIVNSDLPDILHEELAKVAASVLQGTVNDYPGSAFAEKQAAKS